MHLLTCEFWRHALQQSSAVWILDAPGWLPASSTMISPCTKFPLSKEIYTSRIARCLMRKGLADKQYFLSLVHPGMQLAVSSCITRLA